MSSEQTRDEEPGGENQLEANLSRRVLTHSFTHYRSSKLVVEKRQAHAHAHAHTVAPL